ncbi:hypothetical protein [Methylobacterium soli]|uniref:Uncharacterized protein n=1 Tax=Methylobacterium soli TaxID=553447 RepID=A0A6L3STV2_9HYPH|nr:hypothetical protein [Methylobacterium soli]KAB1072544.1 hypothetical protein F6X53_28070 [Methylobacterium soli]GJE43864.1 hypothetical protein AEGHOMDF_3043 [Methylobacterium soli]
MSRFRLHRGWREPDGLVTDHVMSEQVIEATCASEAVSAVLGEGDFLVGDEANLAWLTDADGVLVWSLRLDDEDTVPSR